MSVYIPQVTLAERKEVDAVTAALNAAVKTLTDAQAALTTRVAALEAKVTPTPAPTPPPVTSPPIILGKSSQIVLTSSNPVCEGEEISATVRDGSGAIYGENLSGVVIRKSRVLFHGSNGSAGISLHQCPGAIIEDVELVDLDAPAKGSRFSEASGVYLRLSDGVLANRLRLSGFCSQIVLNASHNAHLTQIQASNIHGIDGKPSPAMGVFLSCQRSDGMVLDGWSSENDFFNTIVSDLVNVFGGNNFTIQHGLGDGCNSPIGNVVTIQLDDTGRVVNKGVIDGVVAVHYTNVGIQPTWDGVTGVTMTDCGARDWIKTWRDYSIWRPSPATGIGFFSKLPMGSTGCWGFNYGSQLANGVTGVSTSDFTPNSPIRLKMPWEA
jgi:hypothetical protein